MHKVNIDVTTGVVCRPVGLGLLSLLNHRCLLELQLLNPCPCYSTFHSLNFFKHVIL